MAREYAFRVDVLRDGATFTSLKPIGTPNIDANSESAIKMSMSGQFVFDDTIDLLNDELQPVQIIDGTEYPVGIFPIGTYSTGYDANGRHVLSVEAYDRSLLLSQTKTEEILHLSAGTNYIQAMENLLVSAGISLYFATPTDEMLATDREDWEIGTDYLTIINTLLGEINYEEIWFNSGGIAILQPSREPEASNIDHQYGNPGIGERPVFLPDVSVEMDIFNKPNVFIVICDNPDLDAPLVSSAVNDNPLSILSTFKRGRRIAEVSYVDNIASQVQLDEYAKMLCNDSILSSEIVTVHTVNLPGHGIYDTVAINHPKIQGIFQEIGWSLTLGEGQVMTHRLRRSILI